MNPNCLERRESTVAPQALHLMNNGMVYRLAEDFAARVSREAGADQAKQIEKVYLIALSRPPSDEEKDIGVRALGKFADRWGTSKRDRETAGQKALTTYCHAIMNSAGFLYVD
jgi:hypothetical protein